jgi:phage terminase large subunit
MMLANCRFDADKCADGIIALRRYQWGEPSKSGVVKRAPVHNQYSHGADAFRTLAMCVVPVKHEPKGEYRDGQFEASFGAHSWMA